MAKALSDTAIVILNAAAVRDDRRVLPLPKTLKTPPVAVRRTLNTLLASGQIEEVAASRDDELWPHAGHDSRVSLAITALGLAALGIEDTAPPAVATRKGQRAPRAAGRGTTASSGATAGRTRPKPTRPVITRRKPSTTAGAADGGGKTTSRPRTQIGAETTESKQDILIALLRRGNGASVEEMMAATGWQAHSVRGFMSGALKKRLGLEVVSEKDKTGERRYYVAALVSHN